MEQFNPMLFFSRLILFLLINIFSLQADAQMGKNGAFSTSTAITLNDYTSLTADANSGSTNLTVANSALQTNFTVGLAAGDLIYIIQIQGASMTFPDDSTYGTLISYNNCGNNEFAEVVSVPSSTQINISCGLKNSYSASGHTQVIRVPRLTTLTVGSGGSVVCPAWNGATGGAIILEVQNGITVNTGGTINASGKGFRGGINAYDNNTWYGVNNYVYPTDDFGAEKGEGIGGSVTDYDAMSGRYCKGAPINGGGGGNGHNAGGGGGGNCGPLPWTGRGNPDLSTAGWASAWNLEYSGFASSTSSGGGKGGYTFSGSNQNALTVGTFNSLWGGDQRRDNGGRGGRPLNYSSGKIFLGGGGGAGDQNNSYGGAGGNGGGLIYLLCYNSISGVGQINSNGVNGFSTVSAGTDGAGGGGAGGTIFLDATGIVSGITANSNGGNGGNQTVGAFVTEAEGPGGGGGGGYIAISGGAITRNANGGANGTTNSYGLTEFIPNGATKGGAGLPTQSTNTFHFLTSVVYICPGTSTTLSFTTIGTVPSGTIFNWYTAAVGGTIIGTGSSFNTPVLNSGQITYYVGSCPGSARFPIQVQVASVTSSISATTVCSGSSTIFTGGGSSSGGAITNWAWNYGNGVTASSQSPTYTYPSSGNYTVTLTVTDVNACTASATQSVIVNPTPIISFGTSSTLGCLPVNATFSNATSSATNFSWNFGDGSAASTSLSPTHAYTAVGVYSVTLTASNTNCTSTSTQSNLITVNAVPHSSFSAPATTCLGDAVNLSNLSAANGATISGYSWNFGDGSSLSTSTNPSHTYSLAGTYNVTLNAISAVCSDDTTITITITQAPIANFSAPTIIGCTPFVVNFTNTTTNSPSYNWNFGDGSVASTSTNPTHNYSTPGIYTVTLIATLGTCADTVARTNYIQVKATPKASFTNNGSVCLGDSTRLSNFSTGTITSYTWDFNDGIVLTTANSAGQNHLYAAAGSYTVHLTVSSAGCSHDTSMVVNVAPAPVVNFSTSTISGCGSLNASFLNSTTGAPIYSWNFGDGTAVSSAVSPTHNYSTSGTYTVTLIATQGSCADTLRRTNYITVYNNPLSSFSTSSVCLGDSSRFTNLSSSSLDPIISYTWNYGDGNSATTTAPHLYSSSGSYNVILTVVTAHCSDDTTIVTSVSPGPITNFSTPITSGCGSVNASFLNSTTGTPIYSWNFGDGTAVSSAASPTHNYPTSGTYTVTLIATQGSCADTLRRTNYITVYNNPLSSFSTSSVCLGDSSRFTNLSSSSLDPIISYTWNYGDGNSATTTAPHLYSSSGSYNVILTVVTAHCSDDTTIVTSVSPGPITNFSTPITSGCGSVNASFLNSTTGTPIYSWNFGDGSAVSSAASPTHNYSTSGTYTVTLIATQGSCADTLRRTNYITVYSQPKASFSANTVCQGDTTRFVDLSQGNGSTISSYNWNYGDGNSSLSTLSHLYSASGTYNVILNVGNANCFDDTTITVTINPFPVINFSSSVTRACDSLTTAFTNSTSGASSYNWSFGDGTTSTNNNPTHTYSTTGQFSVLLSATSTFGCTATKVYTNLISVKSTPVPVFSSNKTAICPGDCISFTDQTIGTNTSWQWQFRNGNPSASISTNPASVCYSTIGNYDVTLTVSNGNCTATTVKTEMIKVVNCGAKPTASFVSSDTNLCGGSCISFVDLSLNATSWQWKFPGAIPTTSSIESPINICYSAAGSYPVTLIVGNTTGYDTVNVSSLINVSSPLPIPTFTQSGNLLTASSGLTYQWYYNNIPISGATSQQYTATLSGPYSVKVFDRNGCSAQSAQSNVSLVGIDELQDGLTFSVFPNPANEFITILTREFVDGKVLVELTDILGQHLISITDKNCLSGTEWKLDVSSFSAGIYFIRITNDHRVWKSAVVKSN